MTKPRRRQAGEGGISQYQTKAGTRYWAKYRVPIGDDSTVTKEVLKRGFKTRKEAAAFLSDKRAEIKQGIHVAPQRVTVGTWLAQWLDGLRIADSTLASYRKNCRLHVVPYIGSVPLARLTTARLDALYRELERSGRRDYKGGTGLSARTVSYIATIVKAALKAAVDQNLIARNPADRAHPPAARETRPPEIRPWSAGQLSTFLAWADEHSRTDAVAWRLLAYSGVRRGEVLALRWRDLDVGAARLSVRRSVGLVRTKGQGAEMIEGSTKSGRERVVNLDPLTVAALRSWRAARAGLDLRLARDDALIFGTLDGDHQHPEFFTRRFTRSLAIARRELGTDALPAIRLHDLRHSHASLMLAAGVPIKVVSERLGHSSVMITLTVYQHVLPGMQAEAAATFAALVGGES
jgi:integrase